MMMSASGPQLMTPFFWSRFSGSSSPRATASVAVAFFDAWKLRNDIA